MPKWALKQFQVFFLTYWELSVSFVLFRKMLYWQFSSIVICYCLFFYFKKMHHLALNFLTHPRTKKLQALISLELQHLTRSYLLVPVDHSVESKPICPACGEVQNVDLTVRPSRLSHPAQEDLFTICLLQVWHYIFHDIFNLKESTKRLSSTYTQNNCPRIHGASENKISQTYGSQR